MSKLKFIEFIYDYYTYESIDTIKLALKRLLGGLGLIKSVLALPLHVVDESFILYAIQQFRWPVTNLFSP
jgi:hypothetical protein